MNQPQLQRLMCWASFVDLQYVAATLGIPGSASFYPVPGRLLMNPALLHHQHHVPRSVFKNGHVFQGILIDNDQIGRFSRFAVSQPVIESHELSIGFGSRNRRSIMHFQKLYFPNRWIS
jgi:hypothetical protein